MKAVKIAIFILLILTVSVYANSLYIGHITDKIFTALYDKLMPSKIEKAFNKALETWCKNSGIRNYHYGRRFQTIQEFANYLINRQELNNKSDSELFNIFEEELRKKKSSNDDNFNKKNI